MSSLTEAVDLALGEVDKLRKVLKKNATGQVRAADERALAKATAMAWFNAHRAGIAGIVNPNMLPTIDGLYKTILEASARASSRSTYDYLLKSLRETLIKLLSEGLVQSTSRPSTSDDPPAFAPLIGDVQMQDVLAARWIECVKCISADAPLAATVMMGGLLEALLLARINRETNKAPIFQAKLAPRDKHGNAKPLNEWGLKNYIDVAHELKWVSESAKDAGDVLRDYRNYVHPTKQISHNVHLVQDDAVLLWEISKAVTRQLLKTTKP